LYRDLVGEGEEVERWETVQFVLLFVVIEKRDRGVAFIPKSSKQDYIIINN